jgi:hypothetical protein
MAITGLPHRNRQGLQPRRLATGSSRGADLDEELPCSPFFCYRQRNIVLLRSRWLAEWHFVGTGVEKSPQPQGDFQVDDGGDPFSSANNFNHLVAEDRGSSSQLRSMQAPRND